MSEEEALLHAVVEWAVLTADSFSTRADAIFAHVPLLRELHVTAAGDWRGFFDTPRLIGPADGRAILASRHWGGLTELNLVGCGIGIEVANDLRWVYGDKVIKV